MKKTNEYIDIYQQVTNAVIEQLEKGNIVWHQTWANSGFPKNATTGKVYRGWNVFYLSFIAMVKTYRTPYFLTFKQAQALGGSIRKGEKSYPIVYWATITGKRAETIDAEDQNSESPAKLVPKGYRVFNIDQTEGIDFSDLYAEQPAPGAFAPIENCEQVVRQMPNAPKIAYHGDRACYIPSLDRVIMPRKELFESSEALYSTLFHELGHSTGHSTRLNRKEVMHSDGFGKEMYSREELTAELTAAFLCSVCGIAQKTLESSAAYIKGWLKALKDDKRLLISCGAQAQRAADFILDNQQHIQCQQAAELLTA